MAHQFFEETITYEKIVLKSSSFDFNNDDELKKFTKEFEKELENRAEKLVKELYPENHLAPAYGETLLSTRVEFDINDENTNCFNAEISWSVYNINLSVQEEYDADSDTTSQECEDCWFESGELAAKVFSKVFEKMCKEKEISIPENCDYKYICDGNDDFEYDQSDEIEDDPDRTWESRFDNDRY